MPWRRWMREGNARIGAGQDTVLIYRETDAALPAFDGHHIQISLADFSGPHRRLLARGLITEESDQHQYRFQVLADPASGEVLAQSSTRCAACAIRCMPARWSTATRRRATGAMRRAMTRRDGACCRTERRAQKTGGVLVGAALSSGKGTPRKADRRPGPRRR